MHRSVLVPGDACSGFNDVCSMTRLQQHALCGAAFEEFSEILSGLKFCSPTIECHWLAGDPI